MNLRYERRSTEAPMDFEFTNKDRNVIGEDSPFHTPLKRISQNFAAAPASPWSPRSPFSTAEPEIQDVSMEDASPFKIDLSSITLDDKLVATGNLTRDVQSPHKPNKTRKHRRSSPSDAEDEDDDENEEDDEVGALTTIPRRRRPFQKSLSEPLTTTNHNHHYTFTVPTPQLAHSEIPYLLLGYLQFFFNLSLVLGLLYLAFGFFRNVQKDVEHKMLEYKLDVLQEISACTKLYIDNFCADKPSPIIMNECEEWRRCMSRDANIVKRTSLLAELIGETIDSFMEPISWRSMLFSLASLSLAIVLVNSLLMFYRARHAPTNVISAPAVPPLFPSNSHLYWPQPPPAITTQSFKQERGRRALSVPPGDDDLLRTPSRRRKLLDEDASE